MKVTNDKTENCQTFLTIEMEPDEVEESMNAAYKRLVKKARVPGFRKGKAPRDIFERYIGKESLLEEALNDLIPEVYNKAIDEQEIQAIAQPQIEIEQMEPLILKATVPLRPNIELGDYKSLKIKQESVDITDESIDAVIEQLRHQHATWEPVERPVEFNDLLVMDVEGVMEGETVIEQKGAQYQVTEGHTFPMNGFPEQLVGMKIGDEKEFELEYPGDVAEEDLAGKKVNFKVKANDIKQEILPEANDEFAKTVGAEFESLKALREQARTDMTTRAEDQARINFEEELVHAVADISVVEYPPVFIESEINRILNRQFQQSSISMEDYLERINKTEEELREEVRPSAEHSVVHSLVLSKLAEAEETKVTDEEVDAEIERMTENSTDKKEELTKFLNDPQIRESITQNLIHKKTIEKMAEYSAVTEKPKKTRTRRKKKEEGK